MLSNTFAFITTNEKQIMAIIGVVLIIVFSKHFMKLHAFFICSEKKNTINKGFFYKIERFHRRKLIAALLNEKTYLESNINTKEHHDVSSSYKKYNYYNCLGKAAASLDKDSLKCFRTKWDALVELRINGLPAKEAVSAIDDIIDIVCK